jgi:hypothetical protein
LSPAELRRTNLVTTELLADVLPQMDVTGAPVAEVTPKAVQDRFVAGARDAIPQAVSTKTAEAAVPTGGRAAASPAKK